MPLTGNLEDRLNISEEKRTRQMPYIKKQSEENIKSQEKQGKISLWHLKSLIIAIVIAFILNIIGSAIAGTKPLKNIAWTVGWIYLTIEAWKYWKWKALLPYSILISVTIVGSLLLSGAGFEYKSIPVAVLMAMANIVGLVIFYVILTKEVSKRSDILISDFAAKEKMLREADERTGPHIYSGAKTSSNKNAENIQMNDYNITETKGRDIQKGQGLSNSHISPREEEKSMSPSLLKDEDFYEKALNEYDSEDRLKGLWAKSFAEAQGNESLAKAIYLKLRAGQLSNEYAQHLIKEKELKKEELRKAANKNKESDDDWDKRVLCSDGACIGVIGPDGKCKVCGKPL